MNWSLRTFQTNINLSSFVHLFFFYSFLFSFSFLFLFRLFRFRFVDANIIILWLLLFARISSTFISSFRRRLSLGANSLCKHTNEIMKISVQIFVWNAAISLMFSNSTKERFLWLAFFFAIFLLKEKFYLAKAKKKNQRQQLLCNVSDHDQFVCVTQKQKQNQNRKWMDD